MDGKLIDELSARISQLEKELESKNLRIKQLENIKVDQTQKNNEEAKSRAKGLWKKISNVSKIRSFMSSAIRFYHSSQGGLSKIEFPTEVSSRASDSQSLARGLSTSSIIAHELAHIKAINERELQVKNEISRKRDEIMENAKKVADTMEGYYHGTLASLKTQITPAINNIKSEIELGLIVETETERVFLVNEIDPETLQVSLTQLKDAYGIALLNQKNLTISIYELQNYRAIIKSQTEALMNSLNTSIITVFYQIIEIENNEKICCPVNITPDRLTLKDYEIKFNNSEQKITEIVNKVDGQVKFATVVVSDDCGLMQTSVVEIFTSEISNHILNILHLHIEDMKDEIPVEAVYILDSQTPAEYEDWSTDALGRDLRYKLLVKAGKVEAVLYNTGSTTEYIHFIERQIRKGDILKYENTIIEVVSIPTGLLTRDWEGKNVDCDAEYSLKAPVSHCSSRHVSDIPGLIDVKVIMEEGVIPAGPREFAVPVCQCIELSSGEKEQFQRTLNEHEEGKVSQVVKKVEVIEDCVMKYNTMAVKGSKDFLDHMSVLVMDVKQSIANNQDLCTKYQTILVQAERVMRSVAIDIRFHN